MLISMRRDGFNWNREVFGIFILQVYLSILFALMKPLIYSRFILYNMHFWVSSTYIFNVLFVEWEASLMRRQVLWVHGYDFESEYGVFSWQSLYKSGCLENIPQKRWVTYILIKDWNELGDLVLIELQGSFCWKYMLLLTVSIGRIHVGALIDDMGTIIARFLVMGDIQIWTF